MLERANIVCLFYTPCETGMESKHWLNFNAGIPSLLDSIHHVSSAHRIKNKSRTVCNAAMCSLGSTIAVSAAHRACDAVQKIAICLQFQNGVFDTMYLFDIIIQ